MFDTPKTKALKALIATDKRITGLTIDDDGVFIYTDSALWCDDAGAGTFRADTETKAVAAFKHRVQRAEA